MITGSPTDACLSAVSRTTDCLVETPCSVILMGAGYCRAELDEQGVICSAATDAGDADAGEL